MSEPLLQLEDLVIHIPGRPDGSALRFEVRSGQCWGILGPNGAGKTTLLHTLAGLRAPRSGGVRLNGRKLGGIPRRDVARQTALVFQDHHDGFPATVLETALIGRHPYLRPWDVESADDMAMARAALQQVDLAGLESRLVGTLSGGERQRLAIATALTQDPRLFLLDEPVSHLDLHHQVAVLEIVRKRVSKGCAAVMSLHDVNIAARHCDHVLLLYQDGGARWGPVNEMLQLQVLERLYAQPLVQGEAGGAPVFVPKG
ncbi:ABC transporter [Thioalkalivibrio denitrificans]|uniref:ABC transporter n=1 Tax=Thioalkalivibrio denitrificans TaxID=108003 RepID=A0A1V3NJZ0_9GAMM|nr:ABC transporter ATP-binding protein [Thioalkalivibrio denitrificans]OOG25218.1 ABC transporter [Thioalkalivibrio denitrificans]